VNRALPAALAAVTVFLAAACDSAHRVAATQAAHETPKQRGSLDEPVPSPDGNRIAVARHVGYWGYLEVASARPEARHRIVFSSRDGCCGNILWASRDVLVFVAAYNRVWTVDLRDGRAKRIAGFTGFHLSQDGKWLAGWHDNGPHIAGTVGVVSIHGTRCRVPRRPKGASDWFAFFSADGKRLSFNRQTENPYRGWTETVPLSSLRPAFKGDC
jgi:hypothetical protein